MAKRGRPTKNKEINIHSDETKMVFGLVLGLFAVFCFLSYFNEGEVFSVLKSYFGEAVIALGVFTAAIAARLFGVNGKVLKTSSLFGLGLAAFSLTALLHVGENPVTAFERAEQGFGGGLVGYWFSSSLINAVSKNGAVITILVSLFIGFLAFLGISLTQLRNLVTKSGSKIQEVSEEIAKRKDALMQNRKDRPMEDEGEYIGSMSGKDRLRQEEKEEDAQKEMALEGGEDGSKKGKKTKKEKREKEEDVTEPFGKVVFPKWKLPPLDLLEDFEEYKIDPELQKRNSEIIEQTLRSFGIHAKVVDVVQGPTVSQYALSISVGTKVAKIRNLDNDIALALAAPSGKVRIDAPIPGTSLVGIEVPNENKSLVKMRAIMESKEMQNPQYKLPIPIGMDVAGKPIVKDLSRMPHALVAGQTGSGKSVAINAILVGLLMMHSPDELRMILVDPKRVELVDFNGIPHLLHPVIERPDRVANALDWTLGEMQRRYDLFTDVRARNIETYNQYMGFTAIPYIIVIIDEMADLIMMKKIDVESKIIRLAQMARATGIHLVLATQRPSVDVVTGLIKANIPARMALTVATQVDSRVVLDQQGAENLLGDGDMLVISAEMNKPKRVQGVLCTDKEIKSVLKFVKEQVSKKEVEYLEDVTRVQPQKSAKITETGEIESDDPYFNEALTIVTSTQKASASMLQRRLSIGYNRAARIIDEMEELGIVGPQEGSKPRKVLLTDPSMLPPGEKREEMKDV